MSASLAQKCDLIFFRHPTLLQTDSSDERQSTWKTSLWGRKKPILNIFNETRPITKNLFSPALTLRRVGKKNRNQFLSMTKPSHHTGLGVRSLWHCFHSARQVHKKKPFQPQWWDLNIECPNHTLPTKKLSISQVSRFLHYVIVVLGPFLRPQLDYYLVFFFK